MRFNLTPLPPEHSREPTKPCQATVLSTLSLAQTETISGLILHGMAECMILQTLSCCLLPCDTKEHLMAEIAEQQAQVLCSQARTKKYS